MTLYSKLLLAHLTIVIIIAVMMQVNLASRNSFKDDVLLYAGLIAVLLFILDFIIGLAFLFSKSKENAYSLLFCAVTILLLGFLALSNTHYSIGF